MTDAWNVNRRWDNCVWKAAGRWHMLCLAADYQAEGNAKPWWMGDNAIERWSGKDLEHLELEETSRRKHQVWTAPSVFPHKNDVVAMAGLNNDGPVPNQHLCYIDPYTLDIQRGRFMPPPPKAKAFKGATAWRDPSICQWGDQYLLTATTGGFRWGCKPNIYGFVADDPRGPWEEIGPLLDPALAVLFAELERPQVHRLENGCFALIASCWSERQFVASGAPPVHLFRSVYDWPVFSRYVGAVDAVYGSNLYAGHWCGWRWIDRLAYTSECVGHVADESIDAVIEHMEKGFERISQNAA